MTTSGIKAKGELTKRNKQSLSPNGVGENMRTRRRGKIGKGFCFRVFNLKSALPTGWT